MDISWWKTDLGAAVDRKKVLEMDTRRGTGFYKEGLLGAAREQQNVGRGVESRGGRRVGLSKSVHHVMAQWCAVRGK